ARQLGVWRLTTQAIDLRDDDVALRLEQEPLMLDVCEFELGGDRILLASSTGSIGCEGQLGEVAYEGVVRGVDLERTSCRVVLGVEAGDDARHLLLLRLVLVSPSCCLGRR